MLRTILALAGLLTGTAAQRAGTFLYAFSALLLVSKSNHTSFSLEAIRIPPSSVNITLNGVALFNCTAIATLINWEANGEPTLRSEGFDDTAAPVVLDQTQSLRMATLRVVGSSNSNNVSVVCVAVLVSSTIKPVERSEAALLLVQGQYDTGMAE